MIRWAAAAAIALYLAPIALFIATRLRRDRTVWEVALDIPLAVAVDLLAILLLARFMRLEAAVFAVRAVACGGLAVRFVLLARRRVLAWPRALSLREISFAGIGSATALLASLRLSVPCAIWDRQWHIPLVSSLLGQKLPFMNVYEPNGGLYYHFSGDVFAAALQALSFFVLHSSLALSIAHALLFALSGASFALLLRHFGIRSRTFTSVAVVGTLLTGPAMLLYPGGGRVTMGQSVTAFLSLSFRPHVALAVLLMLGFVGSILVRLTSLPASIPARATLPVLCSSAALLVLTDEASVGVLGLALGAAWLVTPDVVHPRRGAGVLVFAALLAILAAVMLVCVGSLGRGAPSHAMAIVPWQIPGFYRPSVPLSSDEGVEALINDLWPVWGALAATGILCIRIRSREIVTGFVFFAALVAASLLCFTRLVFDQSALESHRFVTAAFFTAPILAVFSLLRARRSLQSGISLEAVIACAALALPVVSTIEWLESGLAYTECTAHQGFFTAFDFYRTNCRRQAASRLGRAAEPVYAEAPIYYLYAGCAPTFSPGPVASEAGHKIKVGVPRFGLPALAELHQDMLSRTASLPVLCGMAETADPVCAYALAHAPCEPAGSRVQRCSLDASTRRALLASAPH